VVENGLFIDITSDDEEDVIGAITLSVVLKDILAGQQVKAIRNTEYRPTARVFEVKRRDEEIVSHRIRIIVVHRHFTTNHFFFTLQFVFGEGREEDKVGEDGNKFLPRSRWTINIEHRARGARIGIPVATEFLDLTVEVLSTE
jgi:hypothetical protein